MTTRTCCASVLFEELVRLGFDRSYPTLVREIRELGLRPVCDCCKAGGGEADGRARARAGRGAAAGLARAVRDAVGCEGVRAGRRAVALGPGAWRVLRGQSFPHLAEALDGVLRRLGGTARSWRTDRMATFVYPGSDRLRPEAAAMAKHYGVQVAVCPANRPQRKGVVEKAIDYRDAVVVALGAGVHAGAGAGRSGPLVRRRCPIAAAAARAPSVELAAGESLLALPELPFPAEYREARGCQFFRVG